MLSFDEFARKYYPDYDPSIVCRILEEIHDRTRLPMDRLKPTDSLTDDLAFDDDLIMEDIEGAFDIKFNSDSFAECPAPPHDRWGQIGYFIENVYKEIMKQKEQTVK